MQLLHTNDIEAITDDKIIDFIRQHPPIVYKAMSAVITLNNPNPPLGPHSHKFMTPNDKEIWDNSYIIEDTGLNNKTKTWTQISEAKYKNMVNITGTALPSMAVAVAKHDRNGNLYRAKY